MRGFSFQCACGLPVILLCLAPGLTALAAEHSAEAETEARALEISRELAARRAAIEDIQSERGIFDQSLVEAYGDMARFHAEQEDYPNAVRLYTEALQIARINSGLYSAEQLPILDALIETNGRAKQWREVDDLQELSYLVNSRIHDFADPGYLEAVQTYGDWKLRVIRENLLEQAGFGLRDTAENLSRFYGRVLANAETRPELRREDLLELIYGKSQADLSLARAVAMTPYTAFQGTESPYITQTRCNNVRNSQGQVVRQCRSVQVENPRYRQSQRQAKQFALARHTRELSESIAMLEIIKNSDTGLDPVRRQQLERQIGELVAQSQQLLRSSRGLF